jgi:Dullard-like phosphatase family protein
MDETLVHSKFHPYNRNSKEAEELGLQTINGVQQFNIALEGADSSKSVRLNVKIRQHMEDVLQYLSHMYEICVFTAGEQAYADTVLDFIDSERAIITHRLYRQHCVNPAPGVYVKDLRIIADRDLKDVIIVDNSIVSFAFNLSNGIPIAAFTGQPKDEELLYMVTFLEELYATNDVRPQIESTFKLSELMIQHGRVVERMKSNDSLIKNAIADQTMNNASDFIK